MKAHAFTGLYGWPPVIALVAAAFALFRPARKLAHVEVHADCGD